MPDNHDDYWPLVERYATPGQPGACATCSSRVEGLMFDRRQRLTSTRAMSAVAQNLIIVEPSESLRDSDSFFIIKILRQGEFVTVIFLQLSLPPPLPRRWSVMKVLQHRGFGCDDYATTSAFCPPV